MSEEKTSWNNSNTVLEIQRRGRVVTLQKSAESFLSALQLMSIRQISIKSMSQVISTRFK